MSSRILQRRRSTISAATSSTTSGRGDHDTGDQRRATVDRTSSARRCRAQDPLPPLDEQRKIAAVLAAYDELIENNLRRIEILEEMAQAVYREWFVNFRFPGHEDVPLVDSPLGPIPDGWTVGTVR